MTGGTPAKVVPSQPWRPIWHILACLSGALGGCANHLAPAPAPSVPAAFTPRLSVALRDAVSIRSRWWQAFASPELDALEERALFEQPDLVAASARVREAEGRAGIAAAPLLPALDVAGDVRTRASGDFGARPSLTVGARYELDFWGRNRSAAGAAAGLTRAAQFDRDTVAITLTASIADSYFATRALRSRLALARQIASDARKVLDLLDVQRQVGTGSDLQIQLQRNLVAGFDQSAASVERQIEQEQHRLAILTGQVPEGFAAAKAGSADPLTPVVDVGTPLDLLTRRPDLAAVEARLKAARLDVKAARAAYLPRLTLGAIAGLVSGPIGAVGVASAALGQPLFQGGALRGQLDYDRAHVAELDAVYRATILAALRDVEDGLSAQAWLEREDEAADVAVTAARRAAFLAQAQFRLGASDYLSVLTAERVLYQAEDGKIQLHLARLQAATTLFRALGGGFVRTEGP